MYFRIKDTNSFSETVRTDNGIYVVNMANNGCTYCGIPKVIATVIRIGADGEPKGNWIISTQLHHFGNYDNAVAIIERLEENMKKNGLL